MNYIISFWVVAEDGEHYLRSHPLAVHEEGSASDDNLPRPVARIRPITRQIAVCDGGETAQHRGGGATALNLNTPIPAPETEGEISAPHTCAMTFSILQL